jgi:hypothetical protein
MFVACPNSPPPSHLLNLSCFVAWVLYIPQVTSSWLAQHVDNEFTDWLFMTTEQDRLKTNDLRRKGLVTKQQRS